MIVSASHVIHDECWHPMIIAIIKLATSILVTNPLVYINNMMTLEGTIKCREMYKSEMGKVKILSQMVISLVFYLQRKIVILQNLRSEVFPPHKKLMYRSKDMTLVKRISKHGLYIGWIPRNFEIFISKPKLSFLTENHNKWYLGWILRFYEFTLHMNI